MSHLWEKIFINSSSNLVVQFFRYTIVGGVASVMDIVLFTLLANILYINHIAANTMSFILGLLANYFLSRSWVFNSKSSSFRKDFIPFAVVGVIGLLLSNLILYLLVDDLKILYNLSNIIFGCSNSRIIKFIAKLAAVFIVLFWNFIARRKLVFKEKAALKPEHARREPQNV